MLGTAAMLAILAGCQATTGGGAGISGGARAQLVDRDVEAPEVFQTTERALWDGRPSLGGTWVASPDVTSPERVLMRNTENGETVVGALFRRERMNPGPPLQLSSDAAEALGVLAGSPVTLEVVALRRVERQEEPAAEEVAPEPQVAEAPAPAAEPAAPEPQVAEAPPGPPTEPVAVLILSARALAEARAAAAAAEAAPVAGAASPEVTAEPLDAPAEVEARAPVAATPGRSRLAGLVPRGLRGEAAAAEAAAMPAAPTPRATGGYVQVATFSSEENAQGAALALSSAGVVPTVRTQELRSGTVWRVIAGPTADAEDRAAVLRKARALGFADAYALPG
jgi:cell division septation protein DedD